MPCSKCGSQKCCCPKTIRGKQGLQGQRGVKGDTGTTGPTGPPGPAGTVTAAILAIDPEQSIVKGGPTSITGSSVTGLSGTYIFWGDVNVYNLGTDTNAEIGFYKNGTLVNNKSYYGTPDGVTYPITLHTYGSVPIMASMTLVAGDTVDVEVLMVDGTFGVKTVSYSYLKIS